MRLPNHPNRSTLQQMKFGANYVTWVGTRERYLNCTVKMVEQYRAFLGKQKYQEPQSPSASIE